MLSIVPARTLSEQLALEPPQKDVNHNFSLPDLDRRCIVGKLSISEAKIYILSRIRQKVKIYSSLNFLHEKLKKFAWLSFMMRL